MSELLQDRGTPDGASHSGVWVPEGARREAHGCAGNDHGETGRCA
jgi:hypothetical protein